MTATAFDARVDRRAPLHPLRALLLAGAVPLFLGVLLSDMAYAESEGIGKEVAVYFYGKDAQGEVRWQRLPIPLLHTQNEITAQVRGTGLYVLMAQPWQSRLGLVVR